MAFTGRADGDSIADDDVFANSASVLAIPSSTWEHHGHRFQGLKGVGVRSILENNNIAPEARLAPAIVGACLIPVCLFWFGWSARPEIHWIMPTIGSVFFAVGGIPPILSGNDLIRSGFSPGFPLSATAMYQNLGVGWASSTLAFLSIAVIPVPFILMKAGASLRKRYSWHGRKDI